MNHTKSLQSARGRYIIFNCHTYYYCLEIHIVSERISSAIPQSSGFQGLNLCVNWFNPDAKLRYCLLPVVIKSQGHNPTRLPLNSALSRLYAPFILEAMFSISYSCHITYNLRKKFWIKGHNIEFQFHSRFLWTGMPVIIIFHCNTC